MAESENNKLIKGITLNDIYDFVDNGDPEKTPPGIALYFVLMDKVRSLDLRAADYGTKESVIKHLIKVEGLSRHIAEKVYYDGLEYYYSSKTLSKQAQRNVYAAKMERQIAIAELAVENVKDANMVVNMYEKVAKVRGLDKEDKEFIPEDWFKETFNIYTTDLVEAGLAPINDNLLAEQIDNYPDLTNKEKLQIKKEAGLITLELFPDDEKNIRKER